MYVLLVVLYVVVCLFLIAVVLLQTGKRADLAGAFGGGGSQTAFGTRGAATFLSRMTTVFAALFMVLSLVLSIWSSGGRGRSGSVLDEVPVSSAPAAMDPADTAPRQETGLPTNLPPADAQQNAPQQPAPQPQAPPPSN
jgi:preprotein translocase subunit SecG